MELLEKIAVLSHCEYISDLRYSNSWKLAIKKSSGQKKLKIILLMNGERYLII